MNAFCTVVTENPLQLKGHYRPLLETMLYSMVRHSECTDIPFIIFNTGLAKNSYKKLAKIWGNVQFKTIDYSEYESTNDKHNARYFSFESFKLKDYDKVIFMDCDLLCRGSLEPLWAIDCDIGMAREEHRECWNAGVIFLGKKYRTDETYRALLTHEAPADMYGNDQKIYNSYFGDKIFTLEKKWNTLVTEFETFDKSVLLHYIHKMNNYVGRANLSNDLQSAWLDMYFEMEQKYGGDL